MVGVFRLWESASVPHQGSPMPTPKESVYQQPLDKTIQVVEELNPSQRGWKKTLGVWLLLLGLSCWQHNLHYLQSANAGSCYLSKLHSNLGLIPGLVLLGCLSDVPMLMRPSV